MPIQHDDERITAYALGEMTTDEASEFERLIAEDEAAKASVAEIQAMGELLAAEFSSEEAPGLGAAHLATLDAMMSETGGVSTSTASSEAAAGTSDVASAEVETSGGKVIRGPWGKVGGGVAIFAAMAAATVLMVNVSSDKSEGTRAGAQELAYDAPAAQPTDKSRSASRPATGSEAVAASAPSKKTRAKSAAVPRGTAEESDKSSDYEGRVADDLAKKVSRPTAAAPAPGTALAVERLGGNTGWAGGTKSNVEFEKSDKDAPVVGGVGSVIKLKVSGGGGTTGNKVVAELAPATNDNAAVVRKNKPISRASSPRSKFKKRAKDNVGDGKGDRWRRPPKPEPVPKEPKAQEPQHLARVQKQPAENPFQAVSAAPLSTFSIDVDTASYAQVRQFLNRNIFPPADVIRIEEMVNYFEYGYAPPAANSDHPFAAHVAVAQAPWNAKHRLVRIALKGAEVPQHKRPSTNLVFLLDVSGSMSNTNKLPLMKYGMKMLVDQLGPDDRVAVVTYAGESGVALKSTSVDGVGRTKIINVIDGLVASGSTNGSDGLRLAYEQAVRGFAEGGINRVVLASDGDFNVGISNKRQLTSLISEKAKSGVFLTVLGLGMGNYKDGLLETLANKGNGNYAYLDSRAEARKVLVDQLIGNMLTIAKDVKIQVEFNPSKASAYRLIGYENRKLAARDFANDAKDAGEIGAGHTVTALYEVIPAGVSTDGIKLKYKPAVPSNGSPDLLTLKLRYKRPKSDKSVLMEQPVIDDNKRLGQADKDFQFASAVAAFGMVLRGSAHIGTFSLAAVEELATPGLGDDPKGHRREFIRLVKQAKRIRR